MKIEVDTAAGSLRVTEAAGMRELPLYSREGFELLSDLWVKVGWNEKYIYGFSWFGRPIIQLPEDMIRTQEAIWQIKPDVIIETGVAHGGSLIFYASLLSAMGKGRVVGVDIEIRPHNRAAIEAHPLFGHISLIEGSSVDPAVVAQVTASIRPGETVLVLLDSNHSYAHVMEELVAYAPLVSDGSYIVATDGIMRELYDVPRGAPGWRDDNPQKAAADFAAAHAAFRLEQPQRLFAEDGGLRTPTHWPGAWLKRVG